jgi:predicted acyltransferase
MTQQQPARFLALDVLRGMTVCFMIIVNTPGSGAAPFSPLNHASWHGFTPTDLVYPSFLFVVGNAMAFAMAKFNKMPNSRVVATILKRTLIIYLLGYLMYWFPFFRHTASGWELSPISETRILGVLQRIALCYGAAALMIHFLSKRSVIMISIGMLLGYWMVMFLFGDYTLLGNAGNYLDYWIIGEKHLYHGEGVAFEPEGILSTFPSIVNVVIGYYAGVYIKDKGINYETIAKLVLAGAAMLVIAYFWDLSFPINKKLWTSSFVLYTCGLDLMILGSLMYVIDILGKKGWTYFFEVFGKNPLFIYLLSELIAISFGMIKVGERSLSGVINDVFFQKVAPGPWGSLFYAVSVMMFCWVVGYFMDRRKFYVRV